MLPDVVLKEYYEKREYPTKATMYSYEVISYKSHTLPDIIIITNQELEGEYVKESEKKWLLKRLQTEGYSLRKEFKPNYILYLVMQNELNIQKSGLIPIPTITIYEKKKLQT